jgi:hypothetical protein
LAPAAPQPHPARSKGDPHRFLVAAAAIANGPPPSAVLKIRQILSGCLKLDPISVKAFSCAGITIKTFAATNYHDISTPNENTQTALAKSGALITTR